MKRNISLYAGLVLFFGLAPLLSGQNAPSAAGRHKARVSDRALGREMAAAGARLIADYGGYELFDTPESMTNLPAEKAGLRDDYNVIALNARRLDTTASEVRALRRTAGAFAGKRTHLVQFAGPVKPAWRQSLLDAGVQIAAYIPQNTYLVYGSAESIARVQAMAAAAPHVQWEAAYLDEYKIHPSAKPGTVKTDQFAIQLVSDAPANAATLALIGQLQLAPMTRHRRVLNFVDVVVRVAPADLAKIAARPDVISIQPYGTPRKFCERQDQIVAGNLSGNVPSGPGYLAWLRSRGFTQTNASFAVDMSDSGIDDGTTHPNHFGLYVGGNTNYPSRVIYNRLEGIPNAGSTIQGCDGHGNLNSHIAAGYDDGSGFPFEDASGYHYGLGVCPFVLVGSSVIFDPTNWTEPVYGDLLSQAYEDGARISNDSWGDSGFDSFYNLDCQEFDALVRDAQPDGSVVAAPGNQEMVVVFADSNDGPDNGTVSPPATAKNVIAVGAAANAQPFGGANNGADLSGTSDDWASSANDMLYFSGRGPCADGRQKPDLVAPGTHVSGGAPQALDPGPDGDALACFLDIGTNAVGVSGGSDGSIFFPDTGQQFYTASSGTSHATPCVSGGCALVRQYFINQGWTAPSAAMTKAWLMNSARYMTGYDANDNLWSSSQGMGEMNLGRAFDGTRRFVRDEAPGDMFTASGQTRVFTGAIADATKPFRVTVAWTDAPGSTTGAAYNNDLDLTVTAGGHTYLGNVFNGQYSTTGGSADSRNNVESVFLPAGVSGNFTVTITATSINSVGVPGAAGQVNQDFALVVYNAGAAPVLVPDGAVLKLESCLPTNGVIDPGEMVTVNLNLQNAGSNSTSSLVATLQPSNGVADPSGPQTYGRLAPGSAAGKAFSFKAQGACGGGITATLQLQDGANNLGTVSYDFQLGQLVTSTITNFEGSFEKARLPALPAGWTTSDTGHGSARWTTQRGATDTAPNVLYCPDSTFVDEVYLTSPAIALPGGPSQLSFRHQFNLEDQYDGGVLQINIGGAGFEDIEAAGGSFVTGGYVEELTEPGDPADGSDPLGSQYVWSGASDGFMTSIVNLPAAAGGKTIQLRWACGTDFGNADLYGVGGWWIDSVLMTQTNWSCCASAAGPVPALLLPVNGYYSTNASVEFAGAATNNQIVTLYDNGVSNQSPAANGSGIFSGQVTLVPGTNVLSLTPNGSGGVTVLYLPAVPTLVVAAISPPTVGVSGSGAPGAVVSVLTNGVPSAQFTASASGNYSGSLTLPYGSFALSATETLSNMTSEPSATALVTVVAVPAPVILLPTNGFSINSPFLAIKGTGVSGAKISIYDGTNLLGTHAVVSAGKFSLTVKLSDGAHQLTAMQTSAGVTSPASGPVNVTMKLAPVITVQPPASLAAFLKGTVTISGAAYGAAPLQYMWQKDGVKIPGAISANLKLTGLGVNSPASYRMVAFNNYGFAVTVPTVLTFAPNPFVNLNGNYFGIFAESNAQFQSSGFLKLKLNALGGFSGTILNEGISRSFSGAFSTDGQAWVSVSPLIVSMNLDLASGADQILGTVSNASWSAPLRACLATFGPGNVFPDNGKFTMVFSNGSDGVESPGGDGYATITITSNGMISWSGVLADNTSVPLVSPVGISRNGQWPLYIPLYGKLGSLSGWITIANNTFTGDVNWFRVGPGAKLYPKGFSNVLSAVGSPFTRGTAETPVLQPANLALTLSGGGLGTNGLTNRLTLFDTGKFAINSGDVERLTISVAPGTGVISGSFYDPATRGITPIRGVVLQQQSNAAGFFPSANASGSFLITPQE